jgi:glycosyltransferase involved in cell wall biosynthesis
MSAGRLERPEPHATLLSVVLPVFNEREILLRLHGLVSEALQSTRCRYEIVFVNDGSSDGSAVLLDELAATDRCTRVLHLSRNFGHQAAVQAGLTTARGDAVIVMDSDLQDDPQAIPRLVEAWRAGHDVVYAVREARKEVAWKRGLFYAFYRVLNAVSSTPFPSDAGNFGLMDRRVVEQVSQLPESDRYFAGLRGWVGFRQTGIPVARLARYDNQPRVSLRGLFRLAKTALFSFSAAPLTLFYVFAAVSLLVCVAGSSFVLYCKLVAQQATPGWTSTVLVASFFGAINALGIAVLGEYIVRIYDQVRGRPKYIVARETAASAEQTRDAAEGIADRDLVELLELANGTQASTAASAGRRTNGLELAGHARD